MTIDYSYVDPAPWDNEPTLIDIRRNCAQRALGMEEQAALELEATENAEARAYMDTHHTKTLAEARTAIFGRPFPSPRRVPR